MCFGCSCAKVTTRFAVRSCRGCIPAPCTSLCGTAACVQTPPAWLHSGAPALLCFVSLRASFIERLGSQGGNVASFSGAVGPSAAAAGARIALVRAFWCQADSCAMPQILAELESDSKLVFHCGLTPRRLPVRTLLRVQRCGGCADDRVVALTGVGGEQPEHCYRGAAEAHGAHCRCWHCALATWPELQARRRRRARSTSTFRCWSTWT